MVKSHVITEKTAAQRAVCKRVMHDSLGKRNGQVRKDGRYEK